MNKGNFPLFSAWLKQFTSTVFLQSFHAIFLMFSMIMLYNVKGTGSEVEGVTEDGVLAVVAIASVMALIKFEKMIKKLFGIEDSPVGNTGGAGAKLFMGAKSAMGLGATAASGFKKHRDASKNLTDTQNKKAKRQDAYNRIYDPTAYNAAHPSAGVNRAESLYNNTNQNTAGQAQNTTGQAQNATTQAQNAAGQAQNAAGQAQNAAGQAQNAGGQAQNVGGQTQNVVNNNVNDGDNSHTRFQKVLDKERRLEELEELEAQENKARKEKASAGLDKYLNLAGTLASVTVGLGAADETSEALTISNIINQPLAFGTTKVADKIAGKEVYTEVKERYIKENNELRAQDKPMKWVDDKGNRNEEARANKYLERSIISAIAGGLKDHASNVSKATIAPIKLSVGDIVTNIDGMQTRSKAKGIEKRQQAINDINHI